MFARLLKSEARHKLLKLLIDNPQKKFYLRELAEIINYSPGSLQRELALLLEDQLLIEERLGNMRFFGINHSAPFIKQLQLELNDIAPASSPHVSSSSTMTPIRAPVHQPTPPTPPTPTKTPHNEQAKNNDKKEQNTHLTIHIE